jgi:hypothetical protein
MQRRGLAQATPQTRPDVFQLTVHTGVQPMITAQEVGPLKNTQSSEVAAPDKPAIGRTER